VGGLGGGESMNWLKQNVGIVSAIVSLVAGMGTIIGWILSPKFRFFITAGGKWLWKRRRCLIIVILLVPIEIVLYWVYTDWRITAFSIAHLVVIASTVWVLISRRRIVNAPYSFEDDFRSGLNAWTCPSGQLPQTDERGLRLTNFDNDLSKMIILKDYLFVCGVIECEVYLEQGALFNVVFRGKLDDGNLKDKEFYLARFDSRADKLGTRDGILFKSKDGWWDLCHEHVKHNSPHSKWLSMRVVADIPAISLYCDGQLVDQINDTKLTNGNIALFAEIQNVYMKKIRVESI
jgi:hypothetical protein